MEKVTKPKVKILGSGNDLIAKQMGANAGDLLPKHSANLESILFIHEGECIFNIEGEEHILKEGDTFVVPPKIIHQIKAVKDLKGVHFMPKDIKFKFYS